jgi:hypothetical protein
MDFRNGIALLGRAGWLTTISFHSQGPVTFLDLPESKYLPLHKPLVGMSLSYTEARYLEAPWMIAPWIHKYLNLKLKALHQDGSLLSSPIFEEWKVVLSDTGLSHWRSHSPTKSLNWGLKFMGGMDFFLSQDPLQRHISLPCGKCFHFTSLGDLGLELQNIS